MAIEVKICGINSAEALAAAVEGGAGLVGFNFYRRSPRFVTYEAAAALARTVPASITRVAVIVDLDNEAIAALLAAVPLDMLQLHGKEDPARAAAIRARFRKSVMKAIPVAQASDLEAADKFLPVVDRLLLDAKPPPAMKDALPGGNAISFDWTLLQGRDWPKPWMLSGGLTSKNLADAVRISGARRVDLASGVEDRPGLKNPAKIRELLALAKTL